MTTPAPDAHPSLGTWSAAWRYLLAAATGATVWIAQAAVLLTGSPTHAQTARIGIALVLDLGLGAVAVALLTLRRRWPFAIACVLVAVASTLSAAAVGAMIVAVVSMATWRRRSWIIATGALALAGGIAAETVYRPWFTTATGNRATSAVANVIVLAVIYAAAVATGFYVATRRELLASLRERAATAEREQALTAQAARAAERTRIAREMHDQLAHRISLVALHAGALAYREDLSRAETAATAQTIQTSARLALAELRQVLGVLRDPTDDGVRHQPALAEVPALLADAREAGSVVRFESSDLTGLPDGLSQASFRILQEGLTNARKHAPGEPITIRLTGAPGAGLGIEIRNGVSVPAGVPLPSAGVGLTGLVERATLAGGTLTYGADETGDFVVRTSLPWPA